MAARLPVVLYHYDSSPFASKAKNILLLKQISHERVEVADVLPRPELSELLGITYRRIPLLAIGNDVYCDTSLIASALERRFPPSQGYASLFPPRKGGGRSDAATMKLFAQFYVDTVLFSLSADCLPWSKLPANLVKDRSAFFGAPIDGKAKEAGLNKSKTTLSAHLHSIEEQLSDGREWLMDTETPSLVDIAVNMICSWTRYFKSLKDLFTEDNIPQTLRWLGRISAYLSRLEKSNPSHFRKTTGEEAAKLIVGSSHEEYGIVGFDNVEAGRLGVRQGEFVSIRPSDNGKVPTTGKLIGLSHEELVIEVQGSTKDTVRCHFPRFNFTVRPAVKEDAKL